MDRDIIRAEGVEFCYKTHSENSEDVIALKKFDVKIEEGQYVVVVGRNGSGKSTLARLLNALILPSKGVVYINNISTQDENYLWEIRQTVGMVFQNPDNQIVATTIEEDIAFGPENLGIPPEQIIERVNQSLQDVGMAQYKYSSPQNLSGGQKQRIAIAGVLAMKPRCIVLDEATAMLDPEGRKEVLEVLKRLNEKEKITVIHITHHMEEAVLADRVIVIHKGSVAMDGKPKEIFARVEEIKGLGLDVPQITELFYELRKEGYNIPNSILCVEDAINCIEEHLKNSTF